MRLALLCVLAFALMGVTYDVQPGGLEAAVTQAGRDRRVDRTRRWYTTGRTGCS